MWYKYDKKASKDVELGFSDKIFFPSLTEVEIRGVKPGFSAVYKCKVPFTEELLKTFEVKATDSSKKTDVVLVDPPKWTLIPNPLKIVSNSRAVIIPCRASGIDVVVKAFKLKENKEILYELPNKGVVLHKPKAEDSGSYLCTAKNQGGKLSHHFEILVKVNGGVSDWNVWEPCDAVCGYGVRVRNRKCDNPKPANGGTKCTEKMTERQSCRIRSCTVPRLTKFGFEITDEELILHCHSKGIPSPAVQWKLDGRYLDSTFDSKSPTMKIPKARARSGSYSCKISNSAGYFTMYISIEV